MRRITSDVEARMLQMLLEGYTYREIAREQDVTISTVNRFVEDERRRTPNFDEMRNLGLKLKKQGLTLFDAKRAIKLIEQLNELGISLQELEDCINLINRILSEKNAETNLLAYAMKLAKIESETGKSPETIIKDLENALRRTAKLNRQKAKSRRSLQTTKSKIKEADKNLNRRNSDLQEVIATIRGLKAIGVKKVACLVKYIQFYECLGFTASEVMKLALWKQKLKELGIDPEKLGQWIAERGPLENQYHLIGMENLQQSLANITLIENNTTLKTISHILNTKSLRIPCKGCGTPLLIPLKTQQELMRMLKDNLFMPIICPRCGLPQQLTAWTFLFHLGMLIAPKDNFVRITIEQP
jgi:transposase-like protein